MSSKLSEVITIWCSNLRWGFDYTMKIELGKLLSSKAKSDGEYYSHDDIITSLNRYIEKECSFYELIITKLSHILNNLDVAKPIVLLRDIDDTLTEYGKNILRPWFSHTNDTIKQLIPGIIFGICSARSQDYLESEFYKKDSYWFNQWYIFSAKNDSWMIWYNDEHIRWNQEHDWHNQKVNAYLRIQEQYPDHQFILIDDIIGPQFEQQDKWISIPKHLCYGWELNLTTWISIQNH